jgi:hypothetical protein
MANYIVKLLTLTEAYFYYYHLNKMPKTYLMKYLTSVSSVLANYSTKLSQLTTVEINKVAEIYDEYGVDAAIDAVFRYAN